ncbi:hypothetical protein MLD38_024281 [Melastoma candidum]|uniref:Uncharacterized protein n=1 Tax=Melastoma candidum TaxID=119954 RepID=A0ACB9NRV0_9MYRT|nr:hypothetical protein MLD38_024281 [Melastoma candidum]
MRDDDPVLSGLIFKKYLVAIAFLSPGIWQFPPFPMASGKLFVPGRLDSYLFFSSSCSDSGMVGQKMFCPPRISEVWITATSCLPPFPSPHRNSSMGKWGEYRCMFWLDQDIED